MLRNIDSGQKGGNRLHRLTGIFPRLTGIRRGLRGTYMSLNLHWRKPWPPRVQDDRLEQKQKSYYRKPEVRGYPESLAEAPLAGL